MDHLENQNRYLEGNERGEHVINIVSENTVSSSLSSGDNHNSSNEPHTEDITLTTIQAPSTQSLPSPLSAPSSRAGAFLRREENHDRQQRSPLNSGIWISIEVIINLGQIVAAVIILSLSRHENPQTPLFEWVVGYSVGCVAMLPHLYWRYTHRNNNVTNQDAARPQMDSTNSMIELTNGQEHDTVIAGSPNAQNLRSRIRRLNALVDQYKMALDFFFAIWFVVGNVWVFGQHSSASDAPKLYRLCIVFLVFSCIGYAMPLILCITICCCFPCITSLLASREDLVQYKGANSELIDALPIYKFKSKRTRNREDCEINPDGPDEGGIVAAGTDKERTLSAEDAVCCICLAKYVDKDELRELSCAHLFHVKCVDEWLKINALCPLCKARVREGSAPVSRGNSSRFHG